MDFVIYGSMGLAEHVIGSLNKTVHRIIGVVDCYSGVGRNVCGFSVEPVDSMKSMVYDRIIVATLDFPEAVSELEGAGISGNNIFSDVLWEPFFLQIEPTRRCMFSCKNCSRNSFSIHQRNMDLTFEEFANIIDQFKGIKRLQLQGLGEPLLNKSLLSMLKYAQEKGINTSTTTNAMCLVDAINDGVLKYLDKLIVSLGFDGQYKQINYELGDIEKSIKHVIDEKQGQGMKLVYNFVLTHGSIHSLGELTSFCTGFRPDELHIQFVENWYVPGEPGFEGMHKHTKTALDAYGEISKKVDECREALSQNGIPLSYTGPAFRVGRCFWPFYGMFISVDGFVTPCCIRMHPEAINFGSVKGKEILDMWHGGKYGEFRKGFFTGKKNGVCDLCPR